ncbi:MAG TPA: hypothetical protein VMJ32_00340 [Pirellulales bacterium]|nr:hypothetical protein [Pirellulales bacterium]
MDEPGAVVYAARTKFYRTGKNYPATAVAKRKSSRKQGGRKLSVSQEPDESWKLVHPGCARARQDDLEEAQKMIAAGETEIAQYELRWLLSECHNFLAAHKLLGDLALAAGDVRLARGHYGYAYQLGLGAIQRGGQIKCLPYRHEANQVFFEAGRGVAVCLIKMGQRRMAREVKERLLQLDASDPLQLREL